MLFGMTSRIAIVCDGCKCILGRGSGFPALTEVAAYCNPSLSVPLLCMRLANLKSIWHYGHDIRSADMLRRNWRGGYRIC